MSGPEIILNLWLVMDETGIIYSLRARCYVQAGTDDEKLAFLQQFAETDYLVAQSFPVPEWAHTTFDDGVEKKKMAVASYSALQASGMIGALFEEAYQAMEKQLPAQTKLGIGSDPLVCITPLLGDDYGNMRPLTAIKGKISLPMPDEKEE